MAGYPLSKTDSGFLSSNKLVRFSPSPYGGVEKVTDWSPTGEGLGPPPRGQRQYSADSPPSPRPPRGRQFSTDSPPSPRPSRGQRQYSKESPPSPLPPRHRQYSSQSPARRTHNHHQYADFTDFITENDLKKDFDFYNSNKN